MKGTLLSLLHLNPLYIFILLCVLDILLCVVSYIVFWKSYEYASKLQLTEHVLCNLGLGILLFLASAKLGMLLVSLIVGVVFILEVVRLIKEMNTMRSLESL